MQARTLSIVNGKLLIQGKFAYTEIFTARSESTVVEEEFDDLFKSVDLLKNKNDLYQSLRLDIENKQRKTQTIKQLGDPRFDDTDIAMLEELHKKILNRLEFAFKKQQEQAEVKRLLNLLRYGKPKKGEKITIETDIKSAKKITKISDVATPLNERERKEVIQQIIEIYTESSNRRELIQIINKANNKNIEKASTKNYVSPKTDLFGDLHDKIAAVDSVKPKQSLLYRFANWVAPKPLWQRVLIGAGIGLGIFTVFGGIGVGLYFTLPAIIISAPFLAPLVPAIAGIKFGAAAGFLTAGITLGSAVCLGTVVIDPNGDPLQQTEMKHEQKDEQNQKEEPLDESEKSEHDKVKDSNSILLPEPELESESEDEEDDQDDREEKKKDGNLSSTANISNTLSNQFEREEVVQTSNVQNPVTVKEPKSISPKDTVSVTDSNIFETTTSQMKKPTEENKKFTRIAELVNKYK